MLHKGVSDVITLLISSSLLVLFGLITLYSFDAIDGEEGLYFFWRQAIFACFAFGVAFFMFRLSYRALQMASTQLYFLALGVLLFVILFGDTVRGTAGWIDFGLFRVQPVEIVKIILILFLASFFVSKRNQFGDIGKIIVSFFLVFFLVGLVLMQPDFGSAVILVGIWAGMLFVSDMKTKYVFILLGLAIFVAGSSWFVLEDYQKDRIMVTINPEIDAQGSGYNVIQSMIAIGSGGITGKGIGNGSQSQLLFLPEHHTDFIFASIVESLGFIGAIFLLVLYGILLHRISSIAMTAGDSFGFLVASGVYVMLLVQIIINIGMNIGIVPVTGIPLPLLSYGGSSLVATAMGLGMVANIAYYKRFFSLHRETDSLDGGDIS